MEGVLSQFMFQVTPLDKRHLKWSMLEEAWLTVVIDILDIMTLFVKKVHNNLRMDFGVETLGLW